MAQLGAKDKVVIGLGSSSYAIRFLCRGIGGSPVLEDTQLNAIFVPDPDAFGFIFSP